MEERLAIIADDFTGAADTGAQFAARGRECALLPSLASLASAAAWAEVVAFDAESRSLPPEEAAAALRAAIPALRAAGFDRFYKKIDSTLRGNLGAELDALMDEAGSALALVAPSAPRNHRTVLEGRCYVSGRLLAETEYARGQPASERTSVVAEIIARQSRRTIASIPLAEVARGEAALAGRIASLRARGSEILIVDAATVEDLAVLSRAAAVLGERLLLVGSSGLAEALASQGALREKRPSPSPRGAPRAGERPSDSRSGAMLFLLGSRSEVTRRQAEVLLRAGGVFEARLDPALALAEPAREAERIALVAAARSGRGHLLVRLAGEAQGGGGSASLPHAPRESERRIAALLGQLAFRLLAREELNPVVASGGDTARSAAAALELSALRVQGEILPGIVVATAESRALARAVTLVTKAGGFGEADALCRLASAWAGRRR